MALLHWLLDRGFFVDPQVDPWLAVDWYAALSPEPIDKDKVAALARMASEDMGTEVRAHYRDSLAYVSFNGVNSAGERVKHCGYQKVMHYLKEGTTHVLIGHK
jgi:hypothetical protein